MARYMKVMALLALCAVCAQAAALEEPEFVTVAEIDGVEYRQYQPYLVAETVVAEDTERDGAANDGFRRLFRYISGDNTTGTEMSQGATQEREARSTKIAMTAPVRQLPTENGWSVAFVVPSEFDAETVPRPTNPDVRIRTVPGELVAVLRFSGRWTDKNMDRHKAELAEKLAAAGVEPLGEVVMAFYNAPFYPPFLRRNEVMVAVAEVPPSI